MLSNKPILLVASSLLFMTILTDCSLNEKSTNDEDPKTVLTQDDFIPVGSSPIVDTTTVLGTIGRPDSIAVIDSSDRFAYTGYSTWFYTDHHLYFDSNKTLIGIKIIQPEVASYRGLRVGDAINRVRELYGRSNQDYDLPYQSLIYRSDNSNSMGIFIQLDDRVVSSIYIGRLF